MCGDGLNTSVARGMGEWLPISLAKVPKGILQQLFGFGNRGEVSLPDGGWLMIKDYTHRRPELRNQTLLDPIDGDGP